MAKTVRNMQESVPGYGLIYKRCNAECGTKCAVHKWTYQVNNLQRGGRRLAGPSKVLPEGTTKRDAIAALRAAQKDFVTRANALTSPGNAKGDLTFEEYANRWLSERERGSNRRGPMKPTTLANYRMYLNRIDPRLGAKRLRDIRADDVRRALERDTANHKHVYQSATTRRLWTFIRAVLNSTNGAVLPEATDPDLVDAPAEPASGLFEATWELEHMEAWMREAEDERYRAAFTLLLYGGLRRGEVLGLRWRDVTFHEDGVDLVIETNQTLAGTSVRWVKPKTGKSRTVSLPVAVARVLRSWRDLQERERQEYGAGWRRDSRILQGPDQDPEDAVFTYPEGVPVRPDHLSRKVKLAMRRSKVPMIRPHDLRDHAAMLMLQSGGYSLHEVAEVLGHSNTRMLEQRYARYNTTHRRARAALLGDYLKALSDKDAVA